MIKNSRNFGFRKKGSIALVFLLFSFGTKGWSVNKAEITVDPNTVINSKIHGFGWVYQTTGNPEDAPSTDAQDEQWRKWYSFAPGGWARVIALNMFIEPFNDNKDPWKADLESGFIFSPNWSKRPEIADLNSSPYYAGTDHYKGSNMLVRTSTGGRPNASWVIGYTDYDYFMRLWKGVERVMKFCQDNDIDVMLDTYHIGKWKDPFYFRYCWLAETQYGETHNTYPKYEDDCGGMADTANGSAWNDYPYDLEEHAENVAALVYYFRVIKGYTCVKWVSPTNEPNCTWGSPKVCPEGLGWKQASLNLYAALDRHLRNFNGVDLKKMGIGIITNFCANNSSEDFAWVLNNKNNEGKPAIKGDLALEALGQGGGEWRNDFDYANPGNTNMEAHVADIAQTFAEIKKINSDGVIENIYTTETHAGGSGKPHSLKAKFFAEIEQAIRVVNAGLKGHLTWDTRYAYQCHMKEPKLGLWGYGFLPRFVKKNSDVLKITMTGDYSDNSTVWKHIPAAASAPRIWTAMFRSPEGDYSLFVLNDSVNPASLNINIPSSSQLNLKMHYIYDANPEKETDESGAGIHPYNTGTLTNTSPNAGQYSLAYAGGQTKIASQVPGMSVAVYTNLNIEEK